MAVVEALFQQGPYGRAAPLPSRDEDDARASAAYVARLGRRVPDAAVWVRGVVRAAGVSAPAARAGQEITGGLRDVRLRTFSENDRGRDGVTEREVPTT